MLFLPLINPFLTGAREPFRAISGPHGGRSDDRRRRARAGVECIDTRMRTFWRWRSPSEPDLHGDIA